MGDDLGQVRMPLEQLDDSFGDEAEMSHVAESHVRSRRSGFVVLLLPAEDALAEVTVDEDGFGELSIERPVQPALEDLLEDVKDDGVQEVVPGKVEEEVLRRSDDEG